MILFARNNISFWLLQVDHFIDIAVEKSCVDLHLVDLIVLPASEDCEECADRFCNGGKSFIVVFPPALGKVFGAKAGFVKIIGVRDA